MATLFLSGLTFTFGLHVVFTKGIEHGHLLFVQVAVDGKAFLGHLDEQIAAGDSRLLEVG